MFLLLVKLEILALKTSWMFVNRRVISESETEDDDVGAISNQFQRSEGRSRSTRKKPASTQILHNTTKINNNQVIVASVEQEQERQLARQRAIVGFSRQASKYGTVEDKANEQLAMAKAKVDSIDVLRNDAIACNEAALARMEDDNEKDMAEHARLEAAIRRRNKLIEKCHSEITYATNAKNALAIQRLQPYMDYGRLKVSANNAAKNKREREIHLMTMAEFD